MQTISLLVDKLRFLLRNRNYAIRITWYLFYRMEKLGLLLDRFGFSLRKLKNKSAIDAPTLEAYTKATYNKAVAPLRDMDVLNERIKSVKELAELNTTSKKQFYIIRRWARNAGLFSYVLTYFSHITYALAKGMTPVINMQNYPNAYLERNKIGMENAWEYFFKQPCGYGLADIGDGERIYSDPYYTQSVFPFIVDDYIQQWGAVYRDFFQLSDSAAQYVEEEYNRIIKPGMRVIGVHFRGADYAKMRPRDHPVQPETDDVISKVKSAMLEWNCGYVFIATEERKTVERFENAFPGRVLSVSQMYYDDLDYDYGQRFIASVGFNRENDAYLKGLEYLSAIIILTRCNSAILGLCSGSIAAMYINGGKFENTYIFNLGVY